MKVVFAALLFINFSLIAQIDFSAGPELNNDRDARMNRVIDADDDSFFAYRIRSKGKGTSFIVEKFDKKSLSILFSKEINIEDENKTSIEDVEYSNGNVFIFRRQYDRQSDEMSLFYQTLSSSGDLSDNLKEVVKINSDRAGYVNFDIFPNSSKTKLLIKASYKPDKKSMYKTDLILFDAVNQKLVWTKTVNDKLFYSSEGENIQNFSPYYSSMRELQDIGFIGLTLDESDNVYFVYSAVNDKSTKDQFKYNLKVGILNSNQNEATYIDLPLDKDYFVSDVEFSKIGGNKLFLCGFYKDQVERPGRDLTNVGLFSYSIDLNTNTIVAKTNKVFDDKILYQLEVSPKKVHKFKYKIDYVFSDSENNTYVVGEQYKEELIVTYRNKQMGGGFGATGMLNYGYVTPGMRTIANVDWEYEYMDVIVSKINSKGEFEWVKNLPLRQKVLLRSYSHVFKQYFSIYNNGKIYMFCDDHPKNIERYEKADYEPKDLKSIMGIHGSNFVANVLDLKTLNVTRTVIMKNEDYCFAPIQERNKSFLPPSDTEIFIPGKNGEIYIYTEDAGKGRFGKIIIK